jgi:hypothetical protein
MAKNAKKNPRKKTSRRATAKGQRKLRIPISESKATIKDVEVAIAAKLATQPTDLFIKNDKIIIVLEKFEGRPRSWK